MALGAQFGFVGRIGDPAAFARPSRVLLLVHGDTNVPVDISLAATDVEMEAIHRTELRHVMGISVPIPPPEHIAVMKAIAKRPRDTADIEGLLDRHPNLDISWIRETLGILGAELDDPSYVANFDVLVQRWRASHA